MTKYKKYKVTTEYEVEARSPEDAMRRTGGHMAELIDSSPTSKVQRDDCDSDMITKETSDARSKETCK